MIGFLADANHGILCFASQGGRIRMVLKEKGGSGDKKFPAAACIFYMTGNLCAADSRISDKAVGAGLEYRRYHMFIFHGNYLVSRMIFTGRSHPVR